MGFFSGIQKFLGDDFASKAARASALANGDYAGAARISEGMAEGRRKEKDAESEAAAMQDAYKYFRSQSMSHEAAITAARDPQVRANIVRDRSGFHTQNSVDMNSGKSIFMPTEREIDGVNVRTDSGGRSQATYESPYSKIIPGPDGSFNEQPRIGVDAINRGMQQPVPPPSAFGGQPDPLAPRSGPVRVTSEAEVEELPEGAEFITPDGRRKVKRGGAGPRGPQMFPGAGF